MALVGIGFALLFAALGVLVVGSAAATLTSGGRAGMVVGLGAGLLLCVLVPVLLEARLIYLPKVLTDSSRVETNLSPEAQSCMTTGLSLMGMQLSLLFAQSNKPPAALHITIADLPRADGTHGQLVFHFRN